jgi:hypothetical protein
MRPRGAAEKIVSAWTPKPARETRALPGFREKAARLFAEPLAELCPRVFAVEFRD